MSNLEEGRGDSKESDGESSSSTLGFCVNAKPRGGQGKPSVSNQSYVRGRSSAQAGGAAGTSLIGCTLGELP